MRCVSGVLVKQACWLCRYDIPMPFIFTMMTSPNGNIFRVTGHLCGEFIGPGEFPAQRPVTQSFDVFFDLRLNKRSSKQPWGWWFETPWWSLWRHCNDFTVNGAINHMIVQVTVKKSRRLLVFNPLRPSDTYIHQYPRSSLVQIMAWRLSSAKPLSEPMLGYC